MARQMIFTSTPQGLEPGRTGFCTVARHRSLRSRLVRELERVSVYEFNLAEGSTRAKINSFRRFELGTEEFYALTRIRDAGLDYTNRTNYIAHHLIFDGLEVAVSPSPAEIFLQWDGWMDVWEGSPRWFEDEDVTDISSCKMAGLSPAQHWQTVTGDGGNAAYLVAEKAKRPILLEVAPGQEEQLLQLFAESSALLPLPMEAWQFAFTTYLQETDNSKEFAWIGGCGQPSAQRLKQNGAPNNLDLTAFDQHSVRDPMDEKLVFVARNGRKAAIKKKAVPPPLEQIAETGVSAGDVLVESTRIKGDRSGEGGGFSQTEKEQFRQVAASQAAAQTPVGQAGTGSTAKRKKRTKWPWIAALAAVMLLAVFIVLKTDVLEVFRETPPSTDPVAQQNGKSSNGKDPKTTDPQPEVVDPLTNPTESPSVVPIGSPSLAKVTAKGPGPGTWVEFTVGEAPPVRIDLSAMSVPEYLRYEEHLQDLEIGQEKAVTFAKGSEPKSFVLAGLDKPSILPKQQPPESSLNPPDVTPTTRLPQTQAEAEFTGDEVSLKEVDLSVTFASSNDLLLPPYRFPPEQKARFDELQELLASGRPVKFKWRLDGSGKMVYFDFFVPKAVDPNPPVVVSATAPPPLPVTASYAIWLSKAEVEDPELESVSVKGDAVLDGAFVQTVKTTLSRIAASNGKSFAWEADYLGPQTLVETSPLEGSQRYVVEFDSGVKKILRVDQFTLKTPKEEGSTSYLQFLFQSPTELIVTFANQRARNAASRGIVLRLPDRERNRSVDLYLLSPKAMDEKPKELDKKANLTMGGNRVTLAKRGAFSNGLGVVGSSGPLTLKLFVKPSERVFYGFSLGVREFMGRDLRGYPELWVKPIVEDPFTCEFKLFIDYMGDLRKEFQLEIAKLKTKSDESVALTIPKDSTYNSLKKFGGRVGYSRGEFKPGSGKGSFGSFMIDVAVDFFRRVHGYDVLAANKLQEELALEHNVFIQDDLQHHRFWKVICSRLKKEAERFNVLQPYDPSNLSQDIDCVIGTLRFLRESERAFGIRDLEINKMIVDATREMQVGPLVKLQHRIITHKASPEGRSATPKYTREWNRYLRDLNGVHAPAALIAVEFHKAIRCIENPALVKAYKKHLLERGRSDLQIGPLMQWYSLLADEMRKKKPQVTRQKKISAYKAQLMKAHFDAGEWALSLFRDGEVLPKDEWVRFK